LALDPENKDAADLLEEVERGLAEKKCKGATIG